MNPIEDQIKAAARAEASALREVRPLQLPPIPAAVPRHQPAPRAPRWRGWAAPVAAAGVVIAVAMSLVIVKGLSNAPVVPPSTSRSASSVPPYYVTLSPHAGRIQPLNDLVVGDALTGQQLASLAPPAGTTFFGVTGAADDRTFVVDTVPLSNTPTSPDWTRTWYLLRIAPGSSSPARLTRLPIPRLADVTAIALSGSGQELAVATGGGSDNFDISGYVNGTGGSSNGVLPTHPYSPPTVPWVLSLYSVTTGKLLRTWSTSSPSVDGGGPGLYSDDNTHLTWVDGDRGIAFFTLWITGNPNANPSQYVYHEGIRELDVTAGGSELLADSRVAWSQAQPASSIDHWAGLACGRPTSSSPRTGRRSCAPRPTIWPGSTARASMDGARLTYSTAAPTVVRTLETVTIAETVRFTRLIDPEGGQPVWHRGHRLLGPTDGRRAERQHDAGLHDQRAWVNRVADEPAIIPAGNDRIIAW